MIDRETMTQVDGLWLKERRVYTWPGMREFVNEYVMTCDTGARNKTAIMVNSTPSPS